MILLNAFVFPVPLPAIILIPPLPCVLRYSRKLIEFTVPAFGTFKPKPTLVAERVLKSKAPLVFKAVIAVAPVPVKIVTVGADKYPVPALVTLIDAI